MNLFKRIFSSILGVVLAFGAACTVAACGGGDGKIDYTVTARDLENNKIEGVDLKIWDEEGYTEIASASTNANGVAVFKLDEGRYELEVVDIPIGYDIGRWYEIVDVNKDNTSYEVVLSLDTEDGTAQHPYTLIVGDDSKASVTLAPSATQHYRVRNMAGAKLVIESESVSVDYEGTTYNAVSGVVEVPIARSEDTYDLKSFTITNLTAGQLDIEVILYSNPGTRENPFIIEDVSSTIEYTLVGEQRAYYKWISTVEGILTLTELSEDADIVMSNLQTLVTTVRRDGEVQQSLSIEVFVGDVILIEVNAYQAKEGQSYTISFTPTLYP